jgi:hypothetical protein
MNENENHSIGNWKAKIKREGAEKLEGLTGVDRQIKVGLEAALEEQLDQIANSPALSEFSIETLTDAILKGMQKFIDRMDKDTVKTFLEQTRKRKS